MSSFDIYYQPFIEHLAYTKLQHQDKNLRTKSAAALGVMVPLNPKLFVCEVIPNLITKILDEMINTRHGSLFGLAEVLIGISGQSHLHYWCQYMKDSVFMRYLSKNE